jgi:hypothetical protein
MTDRETDLDFDFFEEPETQEAPTRARPGGRRPRRPVRPPGGLTPLLRLVGLIAFAIAVVVVLVLVVQSCRGDDKRDTYAEYMGNVQEVASGSNRVGRRLNTLLTEPGVKIADVDGRLDALAQQQAQVTSQAEKLTPPGQLRDQHQQALEALQFRVNGLQRLETAFRESAKLKRPTPAGRLLAAQMRRLVASDVIWADGFRAGSIDVLRREGVNGVDPPASTFLRDPDLASTRVLATYWQRIRGTTTGKRGPGPHGNALVSVKALPDGPVLSPDQENLVIARADLAFQVTVENSGQSQEVSVRVRLRVDQKPRPITKVQVIDVINPQQQKTVTFRDLGQIVQFQQRVPLRVQVVPVQGEENTDNNSQTYAVTFRISG